jgi:hypothetical protein
LGPQGRGQLLLQEIAWRRSRLNPRKTIRYPTRKQDTTRQWSGNCYRQIYMFTTAIFESIYSDVADQNIRLNAIACPKRKNSLQWNEWPNIQYWYEYMRYCKKCNVIVPISFHWFHGPSNSSIYDWCYRYLSISRWKLYTD